MPLVRGVRPPSVFAGGALRRWLGLLLGVVVALVLIYVNWPVIEVPRAPQEVERLALNLHEGRLQRNAHPFTGVMVEHFPGGLLKSRSVLLNGRLHGVSEGWHTNQVLQVREYFVNGVSHGPRVRWDSQGHKVSQTQIVNGKIEGLFRRWHDNGTLAEEAMMKDGQPDGRCRAWYPSGSLKTEVTVVQGKLTERHTYAEGERREESVIESTVKPDGR